MGTARNNQVELKLPLLEKPKTLKNYSQPEVLRHTFETLSNLHKLLPNHLMELLHSCKSEEDKKKCIEINLTPKPSSMPLWRRKQNNNANQGWKKCRFWSKNTKEPPMSTIVVRWLKKNMRPTEDLASVTQRLSAFGPIESVTLCGRQSAVVVFRDMVSACNAVNAFQSRAPGSMFQCAWQQPFMSRELRLPPTKSQRKLPRRV
ncbi:hypothetical protein Celaphus_00014639 [Cervus elaphus hippelaphus]|uniref:RRM domain-containing protein n=1 Tax=Cervus elaphus hippelaphus TaxID=46360 RepID=A0A212D577_CEREH|nr:hypothetical protein Celaphus_00014639 [Cervus elaphus hippelaphus]